jgi:hypothetical protein
VYETRNWLCFDVVPCVIEYETIFQWQIAMTIIIGLRTGRFLLMFPIQSNHILTNVSA